MSKNQRHASKQVPLLTTSQEIKDTSKLEHGSILKKICTHLKIESIHKLRGHSILITTKNSVEVSYPIEIITCVAGSEKEKSTILVIPRALQCVLIQGSTVSLQKLSVRGQSSKHFKEIPFKSIVLFYKEDSYTIME
jgi:hypothetical protein